eukprot:g8697.t1
MAESNLGAPPSSWSASRLSSWLAKDNKLDAETIDALALCDVDGRMFLEMAEEDLAESDELGLDIKSIHAFLKLQSDLEALELSFHGERPPLPGSSVLPIDIRNPKPPPATEAMASAAAPRSQGKPSFSSSPSACADQKSCSVAEGIPGAPPSSWSPSRLRSWLERDDKLDAEAIDALALCDVDGRMFLEMDEEDLAESHELGLDMKGIHAFLKLQADLEALELSFHGKRPPLPGSSVLPADTRTLKLPTEANGSEGRPSLHSSVEHKSCNGGGGGGGGGSAASWSVPCVSVDAEGRSYFSDKTVPLGAAAGAGSGIGALSELIPTTGLKFRETPGDYDFDFHCAPARQFVVSLDAGVEIEVTDGTRRVFPPGTVMLAEDTWGKGHRSRAVDGKPRKSLFLTLPDDFEL